MNKHSIAGDAITIMRSTNAIYALSGVVSALSDVV